MTEISRTIARSIRFRRDTDSLVSADMSPCVNRSDVVIGIVEKHYEKKLVKLRSQAAKKAAKQK